jgi:hypothetical protein
VSKLRTKSDILTRIDGSYVLRLSELEYLKTLVFKSKGAVQASAARAAYPMIYAHWEGFVKEATLAYLEYVANAVKIKRLKKSRVMPSLLSGWAWCSGVKGGNPTLQIFLDGTLATVFDVRAFPKMELSPIPKSKGIMDSQLFKQLCRLIALDYSRFATREKFIDEVLAGRRHAIVHGSLNTISANEFDDARTESLALMKQYKDEIENLVATDGFTL